MISFNQAYAEAKISPMAFMMHCNKLGLAFEEFYPEVDENTLEIIKTLATPTERLNKVENEIAMKSKDFTILEKGFPPNTSKVIRKFQNRKWWGGHTVSIAALKNTFLERVKNLDEVLEWLLAHNMLAYGYGDGQGNMDSVSLVTGSKKEIDEIGAIGLGDAE